MHQINHVFLLGTITIAPINCIKSTKFGKLVLMELAPLILIPFFDIRPKQAKDMAILWSLEALIWLPPSISLLLLPLTTSKSSPSVTLTHYQLALLQQH